MLTSRKAYYGEQGDELKARSFVEHFPDLQGEVDTWNGRIAWRERARDELRGWVASRLHAHGYDRPPFSGGLDAPIAAEAEAGTLQLAD